MRVKKQVRAVMSITLLGALLAACAHASCPKDEDGAQTDSDTPRFALTQLPYELLPMVASHLDQTTLKPFRETSHTLAVAGFETSVIRACSVSVTLLNREKLPDLGATLAQGRLTNIPIILGDRSATDEDLASLEKASRVRLQGCPKVTGAGFAAFGNVTALTLWKCVGVVTQNFSSLAHVEDIDLSWCAQVTDHDLTHFSRAKRINLTGCKKLTDAGLAHLTNAHEVNLWGCTHVTDKGLGYLSKARILDLTGCVQVTDEGLKNLSNTQELTLWECPLITDEGLGYLTGVKILNILGCTGVTQGAKDKLRARGLQVID
ncbi:MAG: hypothetical protein C0514_05215 [Candidatus Puniceispirillum sp.]|nr:hypothetical protein [Candidatus Puniceispirillum sp.]